MRIELTQQSGLEVNQLSAADMTPAMAAQYLSGTIHLRSFWEMLRRYYPAGDLRDRVVRAVAQPGDDPKSLPWSWTRNRHPVCSGYVPTMASTTETVGN